ncbi:hypothetical protein OHB41_00390 [Streptomyces sp. NBC_01571]|uniref:hypothetical protein n=1 Tax=Streptomyces sp. NBC_01571 TaxID=2975883 RepID=UPI0022565344|nr:hypothetical protein [Streptomyces sp. NBC_01571]MCX4571699.1 hypothetical protein [Streptomyces sp. NBC_01571]
MRITTSSTARRARLTAMASGFFTTAARTMAAAPTASSAKTSPSAAASLTKSPATSTADWRYDTRAKTTAADVTTHRAAQDDGEAAGAPELGRHGCAQPASAGDVIGMPGTWAVDPRGSSLAVSAGTNGSHPEPATLTSTSTSASHDDTVTGKRVSGTFTTPRNRGTASRIDGSRRRCAGFDVRSSFHSSPTAGHRIPGHPRGYRETGSSAHTGPACQAGCPADDCGIVRRGSAGIPHPGIVHRRDGADADITPDNRAMVRALPQPDVRAEPGDFGGSLSDDTNTVGSNSCTVDPTSDDSRNCTGDGTAFFQLVAETLST